jgi:pimeloyl-ACP methyl ester carboxylesterase
MRESIMMVHGMWGGPWVWERYRRYFEARGYRCITPALRHHEPCPDRETLARLGTTSLLDFAHDLEEEIYHLDDKPIVMGHSMGGLLAQMLGSRGLAKALVLLTPAWPRGILGLKPSVIRCFLSAVTTPGFWKKPMRQTYGEAVYAMLGRMPDRERKDIFERLVHESGRAGFEIGFWPLDPGKASLVDSDAVTCPTLVIAGAEDNLTPASVVRRVARKYTGAATLKEFSRHAHWVIGEPGWERIAGYCSDWLERVLVRLPSRPEPQAAAPWRAGHIPSSYARRKHMAGRNDRRAHERIGTAVVVEAGIPFSGNAQSYTLGHTANISQGGLFVETDFSLHQGAQVNAGILPGGSSRPLWVQCRVVRSTEQGLAMEITRGEKEKLGRIIPSS